MIGVWLAGVMAAAAVPLFRVDSPGWFGDSPRVGTSRDEVEGLLGYQVMAFDWGGCNGGAMMYYNRPGRFGGVEGWRIEYAKGKVKNATMHYNLPGAWKGGPEQFSRTFGPRPSPWRHTDD